VGRREHQVLGVVFIWGQRARRPNIDFLDSDFLGEEEEGTYNVSGLFLGRLGTQEHSHLRQTFKRQERREHDNPVFQFLRNKGRRTCHLLVGI
jgi:hypothetical protein